jgi:hypothetical protein
MKARSDSVDSTDLDNQPTPVLLTQVNSAIDDSFLDEAKATVLKKIAKFLAKQEDKLPQRELETHVIKMLKHKDADW